MAPVNRQLCGRLLVLCFAVSFLARDAQSNDVLKYRPGPEHRNYGIMGDVAEVYGSPFRMSGTNALAVAGVMSLTALCIIALDSPIDREFAVEQSRLPLQPLGKLAQVGTVYDDISGVYVLAGLGTTMLVGGLIARDSDLAETARLLLEAYLISGAVTVFGKGLFGRPRPYTGEHPHDFNLFKFSRSADFRSFPSGHATNIFAMMTVLAKHHRHWWVSVPAYLLCAGVALQRIEHRNHWASDVIVGGAIGYWVGSVLVNKHVRETHKLRVSPYLVPDRLGVTITF
jgi:membrane-associated phospholipid phosphatase